MHRAVDEAHEVITATEATPGNVNEAYRLEALIDQHNAITEKTADTIVADSKYGTIDNFLACHDRGVQAHMPDLGKASKKRNRQSNIFTEDRFLYDPVQDVYICPREQQLKRKTLHPKRASVDYSAAKKACTACDLRDQCTRNKTGRTIKHHLRQDELDQMRLSAKSAKSKRTSKPGSTSWRDHLLGRSVTDLTGHAGAGYGGCTYRNISFMLSRIFRFWSTTTWFQNAVQLSRLSKQKQRFQRTMYELQQYLKFYRTNSNVVWVFILHNDGS